MAGPYNTYDNADAIKQEIYTNGPIDTQIQVYSDFLEYRSGIYTA